MLRPRPPLLRPGPDPRRAGWPPPLEWWPMYVVVAAAALLGLAGLVRVVADVLTPVAHLVVVLLLACMVAIALSPLVTGLDARIHRRRSSIAIVVAAVVLAVVAIGALLAIPGMDQTRRLTDQAKDLGAQVERGEPVAFGPLLIPAEVEEGARQILTTQGGRFAGGLANAAVAVAAGIADIVLVIVLTIYLLLDGPRLRVATLRVMRPRQRPRVRRVEAEVLRVVGGYLRGQLLLAGTVAIAVSALLFATGMPFALVLGLFAGLAELVPMLGPFIGAVPTLLVAAAQPFPTIAWVGLGFLVIQQLEAHVLVPRISGHAVGLRPLAALVALLAGFEVAGVLGALFAVPLAGLGWVFLATVINAWRGRRGDAPMGPQRKIHVRPVR